MSLFSTDNVNCHKCVGGCQLVTNLVVSWCVTTANAPFSLCSCHLSISFHFCCVFQIEICPLHANTQHLVIFLVQKIQNRIFYRIIFFIVIFGCFCPHITRGLFKDEKNLFLICSLRRIFRFSFLLFCFEKYCELLLQLSD